MGMRFVIVVGFLRLSGAETAAQGPSGLCQSDEM
jgi:hypothetical protein